MKEPILEKIRTSLIRFISKISGHQYGCCGKYFKKCKTCEKI